MFALMVCTHARITHSTDIKIYAYKHYKPCAGNRAISVRSDADSIGSLAKQNITQIHSQSVAPSECSFTRCKGAIELYQLTQRIEYKQALLFLVIMS